MRPCASQVKATSHVAADPPATSFRSGRVAAALVIGIALTILLVAFGLHASPLIGSFGFGPRAYWAANAVYLVSGWVVALAAVRWHSLRYRLLAAFAILLLAALFGVTRA